MYIYIYTDFLSIYISVIMNYFNAFLPNSLPYSSSH